MSEFVIESPMLNGHGMKEIKRINKRHLAKLLSKLEHEGDLTPCIRSDIMRSFGYLLEDTLDAVNGNRMGEGNEKEDAQKVV